MQRLRTILAITSVRLSIIYSLIFGVVAIILVFYLTSSTVNLLRRQIQNSINAEIVELNAGYDRDGINGLVLMLERAAAAPGANIYVLTEASGQIIAANIRNIESGVISSTGWTQRPFAYTRYDDGGRREYRAVARIVKLPNGMRMLVGRDLGEPERFRDVIGRAMFLALGFMLLVGIATWLLVGRRALSCSIGFRAQGSDAGDDARYCQIGKLDIGLWLVRQGWASPGDDAPETYRQAWDEAREAHVGQFAPAPRLLTNDSDAPGGR